MKFARTEKNAATRHPAQKKPAGLKTAVTSASYSAILKLQQSAGNTAVDSFLSRDQGQPLDPSTRSLMESRFGQSLETVRVHTDAQATAEVDTHFAHAFTVGEHIAFGPGRFAPHSLEGKRLLAHELAHVIQQRRDGSLGSIAHENEASDAGRRVGGGGTVEITGAVQVGLQCEPLTLAEIMNLSPEQIEARLMANEREYQEYTHPSDYYRKLEQEQRLLHQQLATRRKKEAEATQSKVPPKEAGQKPEAVLPGYKILAMTPEEMALNRAEREHKAREAHQKYKTIFMGADPLQFEKDPEYWRAMGKYKEAEKHEGEAVPAQTLGVTAPITVKIGDKIIPISQDPAYWNTPRGKARAALAEKMNQTRREFNFILQDRKNWIGGSLVIRKTAETMVGIDPPPREKLEEGLSLLNKADAALQADKVEEASKLYGRAYAIEREASWYWSRYKDLLEVGAERTVDALKTVTEGSKYTLTVLSMGGGGAVMLVGMAGGAAIETTEAVTKVALGEPVDWVKFGVEQAINIALSTFLGRLSQGATARIMKLPGFREFSSQAVHAAVTGVLNGMQARFFTKLVEDLFRKRRLTWAQFIDALSAAIANPEILAYDIFLSQVAHVLGPKAQPSSAKTESGMPRESDVPAKGIKAEKPAVIEPTKRPSAPPISGPQEGSVRSAPSGTTVPTSKEGAQVIPFPKQPGGTGTQTKATPSSPPTEGGKVIPFRPKKTVPSTPSSEAAEHPIPQQVVREATTGQPIEMGPTTQPQKGPMGIASQPATTASSKGGKGGSTGGGGTGGQPPKPAVPPSKTSPAPKGGSGKGEPAGGKVVDLEQARKRNLGQKPKALPKPVPPDIAEALAEAKVSPSEKVSVPASRQLKNAPASSTKKRYTTHDPGKPEVIVGKGAAETAPKVEPRTAQKLSERAESGQTYARTEEQIRPGVTRRTTTAAVQEGATIPIRKVSVRDIQSHVDDMAKKGIKFSFGSDQLAAHAEVKQIVVRPNTQVKVSQRPCGSCVRFFRAEAQFQRKRQIIVDPDRTWIFEPDGSFWTKQH